MLEVAKLRPGLSGLHVRVEKIQLIKAIKTQ